MSSDSEDEEIVRRQRNFMHPWQRDRGVPNSNMFPGSSTHKDDFEDQYFRDRMRSTIYNKDVDGYTRQEKYGSKEDPRADVGHLFAYQNGGACEGRNAFMQERGWNRSAGAEFDHWNAAVNGYKNTEAAYKACKAADKGFQEGRWGGYSSSEIVDAGKRELKEVGILTRKGGGVDGRCQAMKRHEVEVDQYGMLKGMKGKLQEFKNTHDEWTGHPGRYSSDDPQSDSDDGLGGLTGRMSKMNLAGRRR